MVNLLDIIHINELWCIKSISILNRESQVIYSEPTSNEVVFEEFLQSYSVLWPVYKILQKTTFKK